MSQRPDDACEPIPYALTLDGELVRLGDGPAAALVVDPHAPHALSAALAAAQGGQGDRTAALASPALRALAGGAR